MITIAIIYDPMRRYMMENGYSFYFLGKHGIDNQTLHQLRHDLSITMKTLNKICKILDCQPGDLIEYIPDEEEE